MSTLFFMKEDRACAINIGPKERRKRLIVGVLAFAAASGLALWFSAQETSRLWRLMVFAPFFFSMICLFQVKEKICVLLAAQGSQNFDQGTERVKDFLIANQLRYQAKKVYVESLVASVLLTLLCLFV